MDRIVLRPPPVVDRADGGVLLAALPVLGSLGSVGLVATMAGGRRHYIAIGLAVAAAVLLAIAQVERQRRQRRRLLDAARHDYLAHLASAREQVREAAERQRTAALARHPPPAALPALAECGAWRPTGTRIRYGVADLPLQAAPDCPQIPVRADPFCTMAVRRLAAAVRTWPGLPATVDLADTRLVTAPPGAARALVCSAAGVVGTAIAVLADGAAAAGWEWVKWLPQAEGSRDDGVGPRRLIVSAAAELATLRPPGRHLVLVVDGVPPPPPDPSVTLIVIGDGLSADGVALPGIADDCPVEVAEAVARRCGERESPVAVEPDWSPRGPDDELTVTLGVSEAGDDIVLDLKEAARGGAGPHGVVIGATGSGKSELLRSLVLQLALRHPPERLNLVLIDFKGGSAFDGLAPLPHVSALLTNLADEQPLVDRAADALAGELTRRQQVLRASSGGAGELPSLLVVVDEFAELLAVRPDLDELFATIGRLGRGLGVHLLLASQRLDEGRWRGLESHLSFRIALRTFTAEESRAVLGVADAYDLPPRPGAGLLRTDPHTLRRFQAPYVGSVLRRPRDPRRVLPFTAAPVAGAPPLSAPLIEAAVAAMRGRGAAHPIWLPPLDRPATLRQLLPGLALDPARGLCDPRPSVPLGELDRPRQQRRDTFAVDLTGGHTAVVGTNGSGRGVLLHTAVAGLALTRTPDEVAIHLIDLGGGLAPLAGLPHVRAHLGPDEPELAARMVRELQRGPDTPTVLVVDDWRSLRERWPEVEEGIERLVRQGRGAGVHLLVAAGRWSELRTAVRDAVETRIELRLPDPLDSEIDRRLAAEVPRGRPGRGLADGAHFLAAVPSLAPTADRDPEPALADLVAQVSRAWPRPTPPRLRPLPSIVRLSDLPATGDVRLGLREGDHTVHALPPEGHLLVLGDRGSGRTALLRTLIREVVRTRPEDPVLVLDPRGALTAEAGGRVRCVRGDPAAALGDLAAHLATHLAAHLAGRPADAGRARDAAWLVADDIDLVPSAVWQPLLPLLAHGSEVGLRVVVARRTGGSARALFEPLLATLRELGSPGVLLAGSPTEGPVLGGLIPRPAPPGRARWADGDAAESRFQVAWTQP